MGNYNSQYRDYYNSILNNRKTYSLDSSKPDVKNNNNFILKRIIRDLTGVLVLSLFILSLKIVVTPRTKMVYEYSKKIVNENYDYKKAFNNIKNIDIKNMKDYTKNFIDKISSKFNSSNLMEVDKNTEFDYIPPCSGKVVSGFGERVDPISGEKKIHKGIDIAVAENTPVKVVEEGKVKKIGEDVSFGKYIIIDHGKGLESKYAHLNEASVKEGQLVKKGDSIAKSGNTGKSTGPHLHLEIIYMGENIDPSKLIGI
ncbi:M23 family metallopeptidase [Haloimpatiens sp. FM7315]|uniref:M23 family metallopeptidase n=1 Tax=Haloimpatiens sp. FM7315 TaxID=3298609 RepID=UPI0035A2FE98